MFVLITPEIIHVRLTCGHIYDCSVTIAFVDLIDVDVRTYMLQMCITMGAMPAIQQL
jgi:hypothetical protein